MVAKTSVSRSHWAPFPATAQLSIFPVGIFGVRLSNPSALMARTYLRGIPRKPYQTLMQSGTNLTLSVGKCRRGTSLPLTFAPYTWRRVISLRWVGDDAVFVKRRGPPSPAFPRPSLRRRRAIHRARVPNNLSKYIKIDPLVSDRLLAVAFGHAIHQRSASRALSSGHRLPIRSGLARRRRIAWLKSTKTGAIIAPLLRAISCISS
jgi:hypothetical protein